MAAAAFVFRGALQMAVLLQLPSVGFSYNNKGGGRCRFPVEWRGRYFQSGLGYVIIRDGSITTKGTCIGKHRDYFLFANRENDCNQCMLMIKRHANVLQYKESFCLTPDSLKTVCSQIRIETTLHTLVRDPATPIPCPFQDAYYFDYSDIQHGFCGQSISYAKPCVGATKYQFHFNHCDDSASLDGKDLDLVCVAMWKDGSESYLYTRVTGSGIVVKDDQYRCFNYRHYDIEVFLSMSGDATCRGLRSARDGQFVLQMTRDAFGWPPSSCRFPEWMESVTFRDLEGKLNYVLTESAEILSEFHFKRSRRQLQSDYKCLEIIAERNSTFAEFTVRAHGTHGCASKVQCLRLRQISPNVTELQKGVSPGIDEGSRCVFSDNYRTLIVEQSVSFPLLSPKPSVCPQSGFYEAEADDGCLHHVDLGCSNRSSIEVGLGCQPENTDAGKVTLECVTSWQSKEKIYVILRDSDAQSRLTNCFSFATKRRPVTFEMDKTCNKDVTAIDSRLSSLTFVKFDDCDLTNSMSSTSNANSNVNGERRRIIVPTHRTNSRTTTTTTTRDPSERAGVTPPPPPGEYGANDDGDDDRDVVDVFLLKSPKIIVQSINDVLLDELTRPVTRPSGGGPAASSNSSSGGSRRYSEVARSAAAAAGAASPGWGQSKVRAAASGSGSGPDPEAEVKEARVDVRKHEHDGYGIRHANDAARDRRFVPISALLVVAGVGVILSSSAIELSVVLR